MSSFIIKSTSGRFLKSGSRLKAMLRRVGESSFFARSCIIFAPASAICSHLENISSRAT